MRRGRRSSNEKQYETNCFETLEGGRTLSPISRGEGTSGGGKERASKQAAALSLCWELSSEPCYLVLPRLNLTFSPSPAATSGN